MVKLSYFMALFGITDSTLYRGQNNYTHIMIIVLLATLDPDFTAKHPTVVETFHTKPKVLSSWWQ